MKAASLLAIFYLVVLLAWPCQDVFAAREAGTDSDRSSMTRTDDCDESGETCSPFCICSCCGLPTLYHSDLLAGPRNSAALRAIHAEPGRDTAGPTGYSGSVWQPPKH